MSVVSRGLVVTGAAASGVVAYVLADRLGVAAITDATVVGALVFGGFSGAFIIQLFRQVSELASPPSLSANERAALEAGLSTISHGLFKIGFASILAVALAAVLRLVPMPPSVQFWLLVSWLWLMVLAPALFVVEYMIFDRLIALRQFVARRDRESQDRTKLLSRLSGKDGRDSDLEDYGTKPLNLRSPPNSI